MLVRQVALVSEGVNVDAGEVWRGLARSGEVWRGLARSGEVWREGVCLPLNTPRERIGRLSPAWRTSQGAPLWWSSGRERPAARHKRSRDFRLVMRCDLATLWLKSPCDAPYRD